MSAPELQPGPVVPLPPGYLAARVLDDGRLVTLLPLWGGRARITLGPDWLFIQTGW